MDSKLRRIDLNHCQYTLRTRLMISEAQRASVLVVIVP